MRQYTYLIPSTGLVRSASTSKTLAEVKKLCEKANTVLLSYV